jgi:hypothetical protein
MNHWHTADQLAAGRRADLQRESAGDIRMRAARLAATDATEGRSRIQAGLSLTRGRLFLELRSVLTVLVAHGRRHDGASVE